MDLAAARDRISVYAAPATEADLDSKQCNKCKRANGTKSPFDALPISPVVRIKVSLSSLFLDILACVYASFILETKSSFMNPSSESKDSNMLFMQSLKATRTSLSGSSIRFNKDPMRTFTLDSSLLKSRCLQR